MLPKELDILKRALAGKHYYTFSGNDRLCRELEQVDALLERVREAKNASDVQQAISETTTRWRSSSAHSVN
jgi:hypothetical protein